MKRILALIIVSALMVGCASKRPDPRAQYTDIPIYASLKQQHGKWELNNISLSSSYARDEISVDLSNKLPVSGVKTKTIDCWSIWWKPRYNNQSNSCLRGSFRTGGFKASTIPGYIFWGPITLGFGLVAGYAPIESYFDWSEYLDTLNDILDDAELTDDNLRQLSNKLVAINNLKKATSDVCEKMELNQVTYENNYYTKHFNEIFDMVEIVDGSGFSVLDKEIDRQSLLKIRPKVASYKDYNEGCGDKAINTNGTHYTSIMKDLEVIEESEKMRLEYITKNASTYEMVLQAGGHFEIQCKDQNEAEGSDIKYQAFCPDKLYFTYKGIDTTELKFVMDNHEFGDELSSSFELTDSSH